MSVTVFLDGQDITAALNEQHQLPNKISAGIYPDNTHNHWWDLWKCVQGNNTLKQLYQSMAVHTLEVKDSAGGTYNAKIILRSKYTARNR
jgi:hypothetical protein